MQVQKHKSLIVTLFQGLWSLEAGDSPPFPPHSPIRSSLSGVVRKCCWGPLPSPLLPVPLPLEVGTYIAARRSGGSPAGPVFMVHFKHYFHREWIEKQISNSKIGILIYNRPYRVLHNKVRANLRREKTKFLVKKIPCTDDWGNFSPGSLPPSPYVLGPALFHLKYAHLYKLITIA